uniref:Secreted protein n=1 Tax=Mesocestoides corti TaxID=53468 RepID=A0A5K3FY85_MESCO
MHHVLPVCRTIGIYEHFSRATEELTVVELPDVGSCAAIGVLVGEHSTLPSIGRGGVNTKFLRFIFLTMATTLRRELELFREIRVLRLVRPTGAKSSPQC